MSAAHGLARRVRALTERRSLRYLLAAGANTVFGLGLFPLLVLLSPALRRNYMLALVIAQAACLLFAFTTYKIGVFRSRGNLLTEFVRFSSFYLVTYAINWATLPFLVEIVRIDPIVAQLGFAFVVMVGSYFWHSRVTFVRSGRGRLGES